jgi:hypothetical protein
MKALRFSEPLHGWIDITFTGDQGDYTVAASDAASDCIRELVQATIRILSGSGAEQVQILLEPDYATCHLQREGSNVRLSISEPGDDNPVFESAFPLVAFAKRLAFECKRVQAACGKAATWSWEYPVREVECLVAAAQRAEP